MNWYLIISVIALSIGGVFASLSDYHMLQQNSYFVSRYFRWLKGSTAKAVYNIILTVVMAVISRFHLAFCIACIGYALIAAPVSLKKQKKAIKPLVVTQRVVRQLVTHSIIALVFSLATVLLSEWFVLGVVLISCLTPLTVVCVKCVNEPLEAMVRNYYINDAKRKLKSHKPMTIIGVTGSFGKTSVKFALAALLEQKYNVCYTPASFNTPMGVVKTIRESLKPEDDIFIVEMGAKNIGDIKEICDIVKPNMGIITSVGPQHLETFKTIENVTKTKFELADAVNKNGGKVYLNFNCEYEKNAADGYNFVSYASENADAVISLKKSGRQGSEFSLTYKGSELELHTKLLGFYNIENVCGAATLALDLGVSHRDIKYAVSKLSAVSHRLELKPFINGSLLIDDAYNANPSGSIEAVNVISSFDGFRKIIVTPGLVELGDNEYKANCALGKAAAEKCDVLIFVGEKRSIPLVDGAKSVDLVKEENMHVVASFKDAMTLLRQLVNDKCVVLFENDLPDNYAG